MYQTAQRGFHLSKGNKGAGQGSGHEPTAASAPDDGASRPLPHRAARRTPLPWEQPKSRNEEAHVDERLHAIMHDPSYVQADNDVNFLQEDETRGVRLQLDFIKAEQILQSQGIDRTIVIFGSTRLREPAAAERELAAAKQSAADHPQDSACKRALQLAEHRMALSAYYDVGRQLGRLVGQCGNPRLAVLTGGGPGGMEAANRGAFDVGAKSVGLNITLPNEQYPNPYLTPGLCMRFHYFAMRKMHFVKRAAALVALPGGFGTMDELFCALTLIQTRKTAPIPVVLIGEAYWRNVFNAEFLAEVGSIDDEDRELFTYAETAGEAWAGILAWHEQNGSPLLAGK
jgi:uncharacterized protein (TIGR00730 family)